MADQECETLLQMGLLGATIERRQALLDITQSRADADPGNAQAQRDLSVSHDKMGAVAVAAGDSAAAEAHYRASLEIRQRLAAADPGNAQTQRDLSISHNNLGAVAVAAGESTTETELHDRADSTHAV